jgi:hypothetical protein
MKEKNERKGKKFLSISKLILSLLQKNKNERRLKGRK